MSSRLRRIATSVVAELNEAVQNTLAERYHVPRETIRAVVAINKTKVLVIPDWKPFEDLVTEWIVKNIANGSYRFPEDNYLIGLVFNYLGDFKRDVRIRQVAKMLFPTKNPKNVLEFTPQDLGDIDSELLNPQQKPDPKINDLQAKLPSGARLFFNNGTWQIVEVTDARAACGLAKGSKWCTSSLDEKGRPATAQSYLDRGPFYIFYYKGKKFAQLHLDAGYEDPMQFMDLRDRPINLGESSEELKDAFADSGLYLKILHGKDFTYHGNESLGKYKKLFGSGELSEKLQRIVATSARASYYYAYFITGKPFPLGEPAIATSGEYALLYAQLVLKGPFLAGEPAIAKWAMDSYDYAVHALHDRFQLGEPTILRDHNVTRYYRQFLIDIGKEDEVQWPEERGGVSVVYRRP